MRLQEAIYEWTLELPPWQRDLARRVAINDRLTDQDIAEMIALLAGDGGEMQLSPLELDDLPADAESPAVELVAMGNMVNINRLAPGQRLEFGRGLTVVYGDTGAGKSGHTRLLRRFCRSVERGEVLPDVFNPGASQEPQTASISVRIGEAPEEFAIDLAARPPRVLSSISVFDAACARGYVEQPNVIDVVPRPLVLFDRLVRAQDEIAARLREEQVPSLPELSLHDDTEVSQLLRQLHVAGVEQSLRSVGTLSAAERQELDELLAAEAGIRSNQSEVLESAARRMASAAIRTVEVLGNALHAVDDAVLAEAQELRTKRDATVNAQQRLAQDAFANVPIQQTGNDAWKELWEAARRFAHSHDSEFPDSADDARCELCQQPLDGDAQARMQAFERFVADDLEKRLVELRERVRVLTAAAPASDSIKSQVDASMDAVDDAAAAAIVETALHVYAARRAMLVDILSGRPASSPPDIPELAAIRSLADRQQAAAARHAQSRDETARRALLSRLNELRDRAVLGEHLDAIVGHVVALRHADRVKAALRQLDTRKVSLAQRELGSRVITHELREALADELQALTDDPPRVSVAGRSSKGQTVIRLELAAERHTGNVSQVLSEGEQRALSTAFFLAELRVGGGKSAIVLDDPVTSLDQTRREYVARRLVSEAQARQVVIFTHDLAFVLHLQAQARRQEVPFRGQTLLRAGGRVGLTHDDLPPQGASPQRRLKALRNELVRLEKLDREGDLSYPDEAERWCVQLRQAWEQSIEELVLNGVVRRFVPSIEPNRLRDVVVDDDIKARVARAMEETSPWAHYRAATLGTPARTVKQMTAMLADLGDLHTLLNPKQREKADAVQVPQTPAVGSQRSLRKIEKTPSSSSDGAPAAV